jgi:anti-sigma regulatory factor (Ser/Thr protein kinase)
MVEIPHVRVNLPDRSYQAVARSEIRKLAESAGFSGHRLGEFEILVAEITSNLLKHATKGGFMLVRVLQQDEAGIELIAIDNGPGIKYPAKMMEDGLSTKKTLGQGLGAIKRLANRFDLYSLFGWGTIVLTRTYVNKNFKEPADGFQSGTINVCYPGQRVSGDTWKIYKLRKELRLMLIDGLGHGIAAAAVATAAVNSFMKSPKSSPMDQLRHLHTDLKPTRGGVVNVVHIDMVGQQLTYSGVGNISMKIFSPASVKGCFAYNGIVGHIMPAVLNNHSVQFNRSDVLVAHSDGISARWDLLKYPGINQFHPTILCAAIYKDCDRGTDDSTIIVLKLTTTRSNGN